MSSVLVASHLPVVRLGLRTILRQADISAELLEAQTPREAISYIDAALELAIVDPDMPEMNPILFVQQLRKSKPQLPIVFFGGKNPKLFASLAVKLGVAGYLGQLSDEATIAATIRTVMGGMQCIPRQHAEGELSGRLQALSEKELAVLLLLRQGLRNKDIAEKLYLSEKTISAHKRNILAKLNIRAITQFSEADLVATGGPEQLALC